MVWNTMIVAVTWVVNGQRTGEHRGAERKMELDHAVKMAMRS